MIHRALIHVHDTDGIIEFVQFLNNIGVQIISFGETLTYLQKAHLPVANLSHVSGFHGIFSNNYVTFHPKVYAGILADRDNTHSIFELGGMGAMTIDLVVANLCPLSEKANQIGISPWDLAKDIDLDTSTLIRAAAKNYRHVTVVTNPNQYEEVTQKLKAGTLDEMYRADLALRAFASTAEYEANLLSTLSRKFRPDENFSLTLPGVYFRLTPLRYGENPHQQAYLYKDSTYSQQTVADVQKLSSQALCGTDYLNLATAWETANLFGKPTVSIVRDTNPSGVACDEDLHEAFLRAYKSDPSSANEGTIAVNKILDARTAKVMVELKCPWRAILAIDYEAKALDIIVSAPEWGDKIHILRLPPRKTTNQKVPLVFKTINGGIIVQQPDNREGNPNLWRVVTPSTPTPSEILDLAFGLAIVGIVKSKAVVLSSRRATVGIAAGQMSQFEATLLALSKADKSAEGAVLASDDMFVNPNAIEVAAESGITAIIQPGGAPNDSEVIAAAERAGLAMVFCQNRHVRY